MSRRNKLLMASVAVSLIAAPVASRPTSACAVTDGGATTTVSAQNATSNDSDDVGAAETSVGAGADSEAYALGDATDSAIDVAEVQLSDGEDDGISPAEGSSADDEAVSATDAGSSDMEPDADGVSYSYSYDDSWSGTSGGVRTAVAGTSGLRGTVSVTVTYADGSSDSSTRSVTWEIDGQVADDETVAGLSAGTYEVVGTVEGIDADVWQPSFTLRLIDSDEIDAPVDFSDQVYLAGYSSAPSFSTMVFYLKDGTTASLPVTLSFAGVDLTKASEGTGTITVTGSDYSWTYSISVYEPTRVEVAPFQMVVGQTVAYDTLYFSVFGVDIYGQEVELPYTVPTSSEVTLDDDAAENLFNTGYSEPGTYPVSGTVAIGDNELPFSTEVTVVEMPTQASDFHYLEYSADDIHLWTIPGTAPGLNSIVLPNSVDYVDIASWSNNPAIFYIQWEYIDPELYAVDKEGTSFEVTGKIMMLSTDAEAGTTYVDLGIEAHATVDVVSVVDVEVPDVVTLPGQYPTLPSSVVVTTSDGQQRECGVDYLDLTYGEYSYTIPEEDYREPGATFEVPMSIFPFSSAYASGYYQVEGFDSITVRVSDEMGAFAEGGALDDALTLVTQTGTAPVLPETLPVTVEGVTIPVSVTWDSIDASQYAEEGEFTVTGVVDNVQSLSAQARALLLAQTGGTVTARVQVVDDADGLVSFIDAGYVSAVTGHVRDLDAAVPSVSVVMGDGSTNVEAVSWDASAVDWNTPGTYLVSGTVEGIDRPAYLYVNVTGDPVDTGAEDDDDGATDGTVDDETSNSGEGSTGETGETGESAESGESGVETPDTGSNDGTVDGGTDNGGEGTGNAGSATDDGSDGTSAGTAAGTDSDTAGSAEAADEDADADALADTGDPVFAVAGVAGAAGMVSLFGALTSKRRRNA